MIRLAAKHGLAVFLDPIETGGWLERPAKQRHRQGLRLRSLSGAPVPAVPEHRLAERQRFPDVARAGDDALVLAVAKGIRSADPDALQTVELNYQTSTSLDDPRWKAIVGLDAAYTYAPTYAEVLKAYGRRPHRPGVHGRGQLRGRARLHRPGDAATPGVLDAC